MNVAHGVSKSEQLNKLSSSDGPEFNRLHERGAHPALAGTIQQNAVGEINWRIGAGNQGASSEVIDVSDVEDKCLLGHQPSRSMLSPLLDAIKRSWSSCVGRVKRAWVNNSESIGLGYLSPESKHHRGQWGSSAESMTLDTESMHQAAGKHLSSCDPYRRKDDNPCLQTIPVRTANCNKLIFFIRHGTAFCNTGKFTNWKVDQRLTSWGWDQTYLLRTHLNKIIRPQVGFPCSSYNSQIDKYLRSSLRYAIKPTLVHRLFLFLHWLVLWRLALVRLGLQSSDLHPCPIHKMQMPGLTSG